MEFNANEDVINHRVLCPAMPIAHPQGRMHACLFTSVALAFSHMKCNNIADHIVKKKLASVGRDGNSQWDSLIEVLKEQKKTQEKIDVKKNKAK